MDLDSAARVLGVSAGDSFEEIRSKYRRLAKQHHPDVSPSDNRHFILITNAYMVLRRHKLPGEHVPTRTAERLPNEVVEATELRSAVEAYFDCLFRDFLFFRKKTETSAESYIRNVVDGTSSTEELKEAVNGRIANYLTDTKAQIEDYVDDMYTGAASADREFLFKMFKGMYEARRQYWLLSLYKDPWIVFQSIGFGAMFLILDHGPFEKLLPNVHEILSTWWIPIAFILLAMHIGIRLLFLNPKRQFVPPRLSLDGLYSMISERASKITSSAEEVAKGSAITFGVIGTFIMPGIGTIAGALLGALFGAAFESFGDMKRRIISDLLREVKLGLDQIESCIAAWVERSKVKVYNAAIESFALNYRRVAGFLGTRKLPLKQLPPSGRLLLKQ